MKIVYTFENYSKLGAGLLISGNFDQNYVLPSCRIFVLTRTCTYKREHTVII